MSGIDKSFFIDIKVAQPPTPKSPLAPIQQQSQQSPQLSNPSITAVTSVDSSPISVKSSISQNNIVTPIKLNENPEPSTPPTPSTNFVNKITPRSDNKLKLKDYQPIPISNDLKIEKEVDLLTTVEIGHESFIKAIRNRHKNIQIVRNMWVNGNVRNALDAAVNMDDTSLMADILTQINQLP